MKSLRWGWIATWIVALFVLVSARAQTTETELITPFNKSLNAETQGNISAALSEMDPLARKADTDYLISMRFGWLNYLAGHYETSQTYYEKAERLAKQLSIEAMLGVTLPLAAQGKWQEVEQVYERILKLDPLHYLANLRLGQIRLNRGDDAAADRLLSVARTYYPAEYEANLLSGWSALNLGHSNDARLFFARALMLAPGDTSATRGLNSLK